MKRATSDRHLRGVQCVLDALSAEMCAPEVHPNAFILRHLSANAATAKFYFQRAFSAITGERAANARKTTDANATDIGDAVGSETAKVFSQSRDLPRRLRAISS